MKNNLRDHEFTDEDIELESADDDVIEIHSRDTSFPVFQRADVIAMAQHFNIKPEELE